MTRLYQTKVWQLQIPDAWSVRDGGGHELVTFFRPDGVGMLTVLTTDEQPPTGTRDGTIRSLFPDDSRGSTLGARHWRAWTLSCRGRKVFVRYSCAAHNAELERAEVDEIVQSISERDEDGMA